VNNVKEKRIELSRNFKNHGSVNIFSKLFYDNGVVYGVFKFIDDKPYTLRLFSFDLSNIRISDVIRYRRGLEENYRNSPFYQFQPNVYKASNTMIVSGYPCFSSGYYKDSLQLSWHSSGDCCFGSENDCMIKDNSENKYYLWSSSQHRIIDADTGKFAFDFAGFGENESMLKPIIYEKVIYWVTPNYICAASFEKNTLLWKTEVKSDDVLYNGRSHYRLILYPFDEYLLLIYNKKGIENVQIETNKIAKISDAETYIINSVTGERNTGKEKEIFNDEILKLNFEHNMCFEVGKDGIHKLTFVKNTYSDVAWDDIGIVDKIRSDGHKRAITCIDFKDVRGNFTASEYHLSNGKVLELDTRELSNVKASDVMVKLKNLNCKSE